MISEYWLTHGKISYDYLRLLYIFCLFNYIYLENVLKTQPCHFTRCKFPKICFLYWDRWLYSNLGSLRFMKTCC